MLLRAVVRSAGWLTVLAGVVGALNSAQANVSLKNGNFFVGYTDASYERGMKMELTRAYNSKSPYKGIFGWGWGNAYEVYLSVSADGSIVVHEYGGGAENRFNPVAFNNKEFEEAIAKIAEAARKAGIAGSASEFSAYTQKLKNDAVFRNDEWEKFRAQGKLQARVLPVGTQLHSNRFSYQYITKTKEGYVRTFDSGKTERFNEAGKLTRVSDKNGNFIDLFYARDGRLEKIVDNFNGKLFFTFNEQGLVKSVQGENGKKSNYTYNGAGELESSRDFDNNYYTFRYDRENRHNMKEIGYSNKTKMIIEYYGRDKNENVKSVRDPDGTTTYYDYIPESNGHYGAAVTVKASNGKVISSSKYEYFLRYKATGEEWTYKMITELDGDRTETTYNECCGLPLIIKHNGEETTFEYDPKGHVTRKTTPTEVTTLSYDPNAGKVNKVTKVSRSNKKLVTWSEFKYDDKKNLIFAKNSEGKGVKIAYDSVGRISVMEDQNRHKISFKYNASSKPVEISDPAVGTITVDYANNGEIKQVSSTAGRKIALQVGSSFENLLAIIKPAGVSLSF